MHDHRTYFSDICDEFLNGTFVCCCSQARGGNRCANTICENRGVCRSLSFDSRCACLDESYSGRLSEIKAGQLMTREIISGSWASVAIAAMLMIIVFVDALDGLKYAFGMDIMGNETAKKEKRQAPIYYLRQYASLYLEGANRTEWTTP